MKSQRCMLFRLTIKECIIILSTLNDDSNLVLVLITGVVQENLTLNCVSQEV